MEKILEIISHWNPMVQVIFFLLVLFLLIATFLSFVKYVVILFRGWPPDYGDEQ